MLFLSLIHICPYICLYIKITTYSSFTCSYIPFCIWIYSISSGFASLSSVRSIRFRLLYILGSVIAFVYSVVGALLLFCSMSSFGIIHFIRFDFDHTLRSFMSRMLGHWSDCHARTGTVACHDLNSPTMPYTEEP